MHDRVLNESRSGHEETESWDQAILHTLCLRTSKVIKKYSILHTFKGRNRVKARRKYHTYNGMKSAGS